MLVQNCLSMQGGNQDAFAASKTFLWFLEHALCFNFSVAFFLWSTELDGCLLRNTHERSKLTIFIQNSKKTEKCSLRAKRQSGVCDVESWKQDLSAQQWAVHFATFLPMSPAVEICLHWSNSCKFLQKKRNERLPRARQMPAGSDTSCNPWFFAFVLFTSWSHTMHSQLWAANYEQPVGAANYEQPTTSSQLE